VIYRYAAFRHEFLEIAQTEAEPEAPADAGYDHRGFELALAQQQRAGTISSAHGIKSKVQHFHRNI
jgi:hypothetical protein